MSIVLNVGTGHIASRLARILLDAGSQVTVISRSADKVKHVADRGAKVVVGSFDDPKSLEAAFPGAKALFWLTPPISRPDYNEWALKSGRAAADAAKNHGITTVVILSSLGAHVPAGGVIGFMRDLEDAFKEKLPNVCALRAGFFMENAMHDLQSVLYKGTVFAPIKSTVSAPYVATSDISDRAAAYLLSPWQGHVTVGVHGPKDYTIDQAWAEIGKAVGKQINVVHITVEQFKSTMAGYGMPAFIYESFALMYETINDGRMSSAEPRTPDTFTATTLPEWARHHFKPALDAAASAAAAAAAAAPAADAAPAGDAAPKH